MSYNVDFGCWNSVFAVPKKVSDKLKLASAYQLKVILYILSHGGENLSDEIIGKQLNMHPSDVKDSIMYWVENGVISVSENEITPAQHSESDISDNTNILPVKQPQQDIPQRKQFTVTRTERPDNFYVAKILSENNEVKYLMDEVQSVLGKTLSSGDTAKIVMLYDTVGLPADVIMMLIHYCVSIGKGNMLTIEKMGIKWANEGINTLAFAEEKIKSLTDSNTAWDKVCRIFGIKAIGSPTQKQLEFANMWVNVWRFSDDMIREAYERCVDAKGEYKLAYINAILKKWQQCGVFNLDDVASLSSSNDKAKKSNNIKNTNAQSASYNLKEIENVSMFDD